jgi:hypothetical protein
MKIRFFPHLASFENRREDLHRETTEEKMYLQIKTFDSLQEAICHCVIGFGFRSENSSFEENRRKFEIWESLLFFV